MNEKLVALQKAVTEAKDPTALSAATAALQKHIADEAAAATAAA